MSLSTLQLLTLLIGSYGALLSTILAVRELRKDKRHLRVTCRMALAPFPTGNTWEFVTINAVNTGHRPIQITMAGLLMSNGDEFTQLKSNAGPLPLPKTLEDSDPVSIFFDYSEVEKVAREKSSSKIFFTKAVVHDAEGNNYTSRLPKPIRRGWTISPFLGRPRWQ